MATAKSSIIIGGKKVIPYRVSVQQRFDRHHNFEIAVSTEKIEGANGMGIDKTIKYIGQLVEILINSGDNQLKFKGLVTKVNIDRTYTEDSLVIFKGHSPTYMLKDGKQTKSFSGKSIADIANEILGKYPANLWNPIVSPQYKKPIPYIVQYKETNYKFLRRIAALYGEWFYYQGESIVFGKLPNSNNIDLKLGKDLESFDYGVCLKPSKFKYESYNYQENRWLEKASTPFKPNWLDNYAKQALKTSDKLFPNEAVFPVEQDANDDVLIKHLVETKRSAILSDTSYFNGKSQNPGLMIGGKVCINAAQKGKKTLDLIGRFRIINVTHELDANQNYHNEFEAIPIPVTIPPMKRQISKPAAESQVAVVTDNNDPEKLGRVRVQFNWQKSKSKTATSINSNGAKKQTVKQDSVAQPVEATTTSEEAASHSKHKNISKQIVSFSTYANGNGASSEQVLSLEEPAPQTPTAPDTTSAEKMTDTTGEMTPWIRLATNYASGDRGLYFVPEIGDEVYVDFEHGNPDRPYVSGARYHGNAKPEWSDPDNNLKAMKTRSGHTLLFNDAKGQESITINDKNGNKIFIDTAANNMTVTALQKMTFNATNVVYNASDNLTVNVGKNMAINVAKNLAINVKKNISIKAGSNISKAAGKNIAIQAKSSMALKAGKKMGVEAKKKMSFKSEEITMEGSKGVKIKGCKVDVNK